MILISTNSVQCPHISANYFFNTLFRKDTYIWVAFESSSRRDSDKIIIKHLERFKWIDGEGSVFIKLTLVRHKGE